MSANLYGINVDMAVINKIMVSSTDQYYARWASFQQSKVEEAKANFFPLPIREVQLYPTELRGVEMLSQHGDKLFGNDDPASVFYRGQPYRFESEEGGVRMTVQVPFSEKDDFDIERIGDQLSVGVKTAAGRIVNIVPLPTVTAGMKLSKARLEDKKLTVLFEKKPNLDHKPG
jgi:arsenite-transporting ATPase